MYNLTNKFKKVLVLLSTYNGEKYLNEQLDSIFRQKGIDLHLLIRDDGSSDSTPKIINQYSSYYNNTTILLGNNIGCGLSFNVLAEHAYTKMGFYDYYAFCDQDDVWDEDKMVCAVDCLEKQRENPYRLYTCAYRVVDHELKNKYVQRYRYRHTLGEALMMLNTIGCTQVFSNELLKQSLKRTGIAESNRPGMPNHDGWMYLVAIVKNAYIHYDQNPHIYYRQHGNNIMGAYQGKTFNRIRRFVNGKNVKSTISKILFDTYQILDDDKRQLLKLNYSYRNSIKDKIKLLRAKEMCTNYFAINIGFRILVILNIY